MTIIGKLATSTAMASTVLQVTPLSDESQKMVVALVSSVIVQVTIKLWEHFQKKRRIRRISKSYGGNTQKK